MRTGLPLECPANSQEGRQHSARPRRWPAIHAAWKVTLRNSTRASRCSKRSAITCWATACTRATASFRFWPYATTPERAGISAGQRPASSRSISIVNVTPAMYHPARLSNGADESQQESDQAPPRIEPIGWATSGCSMTLQKGKSRSSRTSRKPRRRRGSPREGRQAQKPGQVALARLAVDEEIVIFLHGRPAGVLLGFSSEEDWFEYRLTHHPGFLCRIEEARTVLRAGHGIPLGEVE